MIRAAQPAGGRPARRADVLHRLLVERDLDVCHELLAPDHVDHDAPPVSPPGPTATRAYVEEMLQAQPDLHFRIEECLAAWPQRCSAGRLAVGGGITARDGFLRLCAAGRIAERWSAYATL